MTIETTPGGVPISPPNVPMCRLRFYGSCGTEGCAVCRPLYDRDREPIPGTEGAHDGVRGYDERRPEGRRWTASVEDPAPVVCVGCGSDMPDGADLTDGSAVPWCSDCAGECEGCGTVRPWDDLAVVDGSPYCESHVSGCEECGDVRLRADLNYLYDGWTHVYRCADCTPGCGECGGASLELDDDDLCPDCRRSEGVRNLGAYCHTSARTWLGGPLPRATDGAFDGYYVGIELEIGTDSGDADRVREWAADHLGDSGAVDCKPDGSVDGFEIATQPMTPAYFESVDWESLFDVLAAEFPVLTHDEDGARSDLCDPGAHGGECSGHGLHVHIGRTAFGRDDVASAAFVYLLTGGTNADQLQRIARRGPTHYCRKLRKGISQALMNGPAMRDEDRQWNAQTSRLDRESWSNRYQAINLTNRATIEVRAFRSTRRASDLLDAVRVVYLAADYVRSLRIGRGFVSPRALHWSSFAAWVRDTMPAAYPMIAGE